MKNQKQAMNSNIVLIQKNNGGKKSIAQNKQFGNNSNVNNSMMHINVGKSMNLGSLQTGGSQHMGLNQSYDGKLLQGNSYGPG